MSLRPPHIALLMLALVGGFSHAAVGDSAKPYIFGWPFADMTDKPVRGGTTTGVPVTPVTETTEAFKRIHADGLSKQARDRRAILAMAGGYRVSFDFLEMLGFAPDFQPAAPYRSWATEYIYVVADEPRFVSLQHILVMSFVDDEGNTQGPFINKHWRQDWRYEAESAHVYAGGNTWSVETPADVSGQWLQTVWQVDDSPRYAAWGKWTHMPESSSWMSGETWRPVPRREYTARQDYGALVGSNRHVILPTGWVQEERNAKVVLDAAGDIDKRLAVEYGIARYERITGYNFGAGNDYWNKTGAFWRTVRQTWAALMTKHEALHLKARVDDKRLFEPLFGRAQAIADGADFSAEDNRAFVTETLKRYVARNADAGAVTY
jgi:hypothetical protein